MTFVQDLPPPGGFSPITYRRHLPKRGPPGWALLAGSMGMIIGGFLLHAKGTRISRELEREKRQARLALLPLLQAETDLAYVRRVRESEAIEATIMKDHPGWQQDTPIYHSPARFAPRNFLITDFFS